MRQWKRLLGCLVAVLLLVHLTACGESKEATKDHTSTMESEDANSNVGTEEEVKEPKKASIEEQAETFIHLFYDWNYADVEAKKLEDYVTKNFLNQQGSVDADGHEDHDTADPNFYIQLKEIQVFTPYNWQPKDTREVSILVSFDSEYGSKNTINFARKKIVMLTMKTEQGAWRVDSWKEQSQMEDS
ncbi:hypothetical protein [Listeria booriae]|uniref:DUF3828 domain-containing protein n=1 Tax=Listeria booriae TaxID=1552123 RepID=A0A7X0XM42_9LIST|nr:hypothetical protein [Listeria booriae]MBC1563589.1 hypothetical protein [Listeria booriae]